MITDDLLSTLPPGTLGIDCEMHFENCKHWAHKVQDGVILSLEMQEFLNGERRKRSEMGNS